MTAINRIKNRVVSFKRDESGVLTAEAILIFPILIWSMSLTFNYFDAFRQSASNIKAAFTISDLVSRETEEITQVYVDTMHELMVRMVNNDSEMKMRISLIEYDKENNIHKVLWSEPRGFDFRWTTDNIDHIVGDLPPMTNEDTLILVETSNEFDPIFKTGLSENVRFTNFVFTRPRFTNRIAENL